MAPSRPTAIPAGTSPATSGSPSPGGLTRRSFLQLLGSTAAASALAASAPQVLLAKEAELRAQGVIVGQGDHTYEVMHGWGPLPAGIHYGNTHGVVIDSHGRVIIHNQSKDSMCFFAPDGAFIKSWGAEYGSGAHGLQLRNEGGTEYLYLALTGQHRVVKTTLDGQKVLELGYPKQCTAYQNANQYVPTNIAFAPNGDFYVADGYGLSWIHQYNLAGEYIRSWGGGGTDPGKMNCPHGIWLDTRGAEPQLVVADRGNSRMQYFTLDGKHISFVTDELRMPCHFDQRRGELLIPDLKGRVTIFNHDNKLITHLGDNPDPGKRGNNGVPQGQLVDGQFCSPHAACWDNLGDIYVVEWLNYGRVSKLRKV